MRHAIVVLGFALALGACGKTPQPGEMSSAAAQAALRHILPANTPAYAQVYNGAWIDSTSSFENGGVITYTVPAKADDIAKFYDGTAAGGALTRSFDTNAWHARQDSNTSPSRVLIYGQSGTSRSLYVNLDASQEGYTKVALVYGAR